jgi:outer membrane protein, heavy metal efflux system
MSHIRLAGVTACGALCALVFAPTLLAQAGGARSSPISLEEAVDEAVQHNLELLARRSNLTIADAAMISARLRPNPVASFGADHLDLLGTGFNSINNGGPPELSWRVDLPIERGGKRAARMAVAAAMKSAAEADFADAVRSLRLDVTMACVDVLAAQATRVLLAQNLRSFEDLVRVNVTRASAGSIPRFEATRSEVAMLQFRTTVRRADLALATASARLRVLLGRATDDPIEIVGGLRAPGQDAMPDVDELEALAIDVRPDLRSLQLSQARSVADLRLQEALGTIDYTVGAEYRRQQGAFGISPRSNSLGFFVSAPLPVFNRNEGEIARARAESDQVRLQIAARRAQIIADVRTTYHEYETDRDLVAAIEHDLLTPATKVRDVAAYTYSSGASALLEWLDAERAFNDTMQSYVDAQAELRRASSKMNAAVGMEVVP